MQRRSSQLEMRPQSSWELNGKKNVRLAEIQSLASAIQMQSVLTNGATKRAENRPLTKFSGKMNWMKL